MVICIVALVVFSFLSIFSAKYRVVAKDAFKCVGKMVMFKPCDVQLETKIKNKMTSKLMFAPALARFFYKNFKYLSWIFTIAFFASLAYSAYGIFNLIVFGSCTPGAPCVITDIGVFMGMCILDIEKYMAYAIVAVLLIGLAYFLVKRQKVKSSS